MINMHYDEYALYRDSKGKVKYNAKCNKCAHDCKQSYRVRITHCNDYVDYRKMAVPKNNQKPDKTRIKPS